MEIIYYVLAAVCLVLFMHAVRSCLAASKRADRAIEDAILRRRIEELQGNKDKEGENAGQE